MAVANLLGRHGDGRLDLDLRVDHGLSHGLVYARHNLVQLELKSTTVVLLAKIVHVFFIVYVIDLDLEMLRLLKVILDSHLGDPMGREVIVDNLSLAKLTPHITLLLVENEEWIR